MRDDVDEGAVSGAGLVYRLGGRLSVRGDWTASLMRPGERRALRHRGNIFASGSETELHHVTGGLKIEASDPDGNDIQVRAYAGARVTFFSTEETRLAEGGEFVQFTLGSSLEFAVPLSVGVRFIVRGDLYVVAFRVGAPAHLLKEVTFPFAGLPPTTVMNRTPLSD